MTGESVTQHFIPLQARYLGRSLSALVERTKNASARRSSRATAKLSPRASVSLPGNGLVVDSSNRHTSRSSRHLYEQSCKRATRRQDKGW